MTEKTAYQALAGEEVGDEIANMAHLDLFRFDFRIGHCFLQALGKHVVQLATFPGPVPGKVCLAAA